MQAVGYDAVGSVATLYPTLHTLCGCVVVYRRGHFRGVQPWTLLAAWWRTAVDTFEVYSRGHFWLRGTGGVQPWTLSRRTDVDTSGDIDIATGM